MKYKIFCDESNHLSSDKSNLMVIGGIAVNNERVEYINRYIKYLKHKYNATNELNGQNSIITREIFIRNF